MATAGLDEIERRNVEFSWTFRDLDNAVDAQLAAGPVVDISRQVGVDGSAVRWASSSIRAYSATARC